VYSVVIMCATEGLQDYCCNDNAIPYKIFFAQLHVIVYDYQLELVVSLWSYVGIALDSSVLQIVNTAQGIMIM
jgi:hypothetical protein